MKHSIYVGKEHYDRANKRNRSQTETCLLATAIKDEFPGQNVSVGFDFGHIYDPVTYKQRMFNVSPEGQDLIKKFTRRSWFLRWRLPKVVDITFRED